MRLHMGLLVAGVAVALAGTRAEAKVIAPAGARVFRLDGAGVTYAQGADVAVYVTVGTGIGGGAIVAGRPVHGLRDLEMGHMLPRRHPDDRDFAGICPFHGDCLEGLASGPAILARWGMSLSELPPRDRGPEIIADYLAQLVVAQQAIVSPQRIVFGGGVLATPGLLDRVRARAEALAAGYFGNAGGLIVAPGLGERAGLLGALALAQRVLQ
ncbi:ROK family protein [Sphingomonas sp. PAMC 26605]|uniref:ROK family protein n=1 Tax=Sphingomonas sp. PAMC 26605 TaxID=1112214 RepID=UPI000302DE2D|nr:ROK family protein [Sphingomonas sp. PAMC 26605]